MWLMLNDTMAQCGDQIMQCGIDDETCSVCVGRPEGALIRARPEAVPQPREEPRCVLTALVAREQRLRRAAARIEAQAGTRGGTDGQV